MFLIQAWEHQEAGRETTILSELKTYQPRELNIRRLTSKRVENYQQTELQCLFAK